MQNITSELIGSENLTSPHSDITIAVVTINTLRILFGLLAIGGNFLIILCVIQYRTLRTTTNLVIANLAAANFLNGCVTLWNGLMLLTSCSGLSPASVTVETIRRVVSLCVFFGNNMAILLIAIERFLCLKLALRYNTIVTIQRAAVSIVFIWICCGALCFGVFVKNFINLVCLVTSIFVVFLYSYIAFVAYKKSRNIVPQPQITHGRTAELLDNRKAEWKITKFLAIVLGVYFLSFLPWIVILSLGDRHIVYTCGDNSWLVFTAVITWNFNICFDPFVYVWKSEKFRICVKKRLGIKSDDLNF